MTYRFLSPALAELTEAAEYYEEKIPGLGADFVDEAEAAISRLLGFPEAWGRISEDFRHCSLRRFPYTIVYRELSGAEILIVSVFHQSREAGHMEEEPLSDLSEKVSWFADGERSEVMLWRSS